MEWGLALHVLLCNHKLDRNASGVERANDPETTASRAALNTFCAKPQHQLQHVEGRNVPDLHDGIANHVANGHKEHEDHLPSRFAL